MILKDQESNITIIKTKVVKTPLHKSLSLKQCIIQIQKTVWRDPTLLVLGLDQCPFLFLDSMLVFHEILYWNLVIPEYIPEWLMILSLIQCSNNTNNWSYKTFICGIGLFLVQYNEVPIQYNMIHNGKCEYNVHHTHNRCHVTPNLV